MGVYISGIEIPKDRPQLLWVYPNGKVMTLQSDVDPWKELQAVPVPEHGRCIDADVLCKVLQRNSEEEWNNKTAPFSWAYAYDCVKDTVEDMPTIIPADPAEEGE